MKVDSFTCATGRLGLAIAFALSSAGCGQSNSGQPGGGFSTGGASGGSGASTNGSSGGSGASDDGGTNGGGGTGTSGGDGGGGGGGSGGGASDGGEVTDDGGASGDGGTNAQGSCLDGITDYEDAGPFTFTTTMSGSVNFWIPAVPAGCKVPVIHLANGTNVCIDGREVAGAGATREVRPAVPGDLSRGDLLVALPLFRVQDLHLCHHVNGHDNPPMSVFQGSGNGQYLDLEERARGEQAGHLNGCDGRPGRGRSRGYRI